MCNTGHEVDIRTSWNPESVRERQYAVRKSRIQRIRKRMGDQVDDFEPDVSTNGQSERAVQTMKNMLKRSNDEGRDPY